MKRMIPSLFNNKFASEPVLSYTTGLLLWCKSDTGVLNTSDAAATNGQGVKTWQDQSGGGFDLQQATAGLRPEYNTTAFARPVLTFDELDPNFLITTTTSPADTPSYSIFLAWAPRAGINANCIVLNTNQAGVGSFFLEGEGTDTFYLNAGASVLGSAYTLDTMAYTTLVFNGASSKHYKDGVQQGTTANPGSRNLAGFCLGAYITGSDPSHIHVGEVLIYDTELSAENLATVHAYLAAKWS